MPRTCRRSQGSLGPIRPLISSRAKTTCRQEGSVSAGTGGGGRWTAWTSWTLPVCVGPPPHTAQFPPLHQRTWASPTAQIRATRTEGLRGE